MNITFQYLIVKNLNSVGNVPIKIDFKNGINLIVGENGTGKSSIIGDGLCYNIFGQPYRDVKIEHIINRNNRKALYTESCFDDGKDTYIIKRGIKPNILQIFKNGDELKYLSSKKLIQNDIDNILGINSILFKQIISFSSSYNKSFLILKPKEKRNIIETIFNIRVFGIMSKLAKNENSQNKIEFDQLTKILKINENNVLSSKKLLDTVKQQIDTFEQDKKDNIKNVKSKISILDKDIKELDKSIQDVQNTINETELKIDSFDDPYSMLKETNDKILLLKSEIKRNVNDLKFFEDNEICPTCNTEMDITHREKHKTELNKLIKTLGNDLESKILEKNILLEKQTYLESIKQTISDKKNELNLLTFKLSSNEKNREELETELDSIKSKKISKESLSEVESDLNKKIEEYKENSERYNNLETDNQTLKLILDILSDNGIKSYFFKKLLPILNHKINYYLKHYELPISLNFDEYLDEHISHILHKNDEVPYLGFSEGEKRKIDSSILFSFYDTIKFISNWDCNILLFDEIFDTNVDDLALYKTTEIIKNYILNNENLCVYIITHRVSDMNCDRKYIFEKKRHFTEVTIKENKKQMSYE